VEVKRQATKWALFLDRSSPNLNSKGGHGWFLLSKSQFLDWHEIHHERGLMKNTCIRFWYVANCEYILNIS
jgi:hypothetical protein